MIKKNKIIMTVSISILILVGIIVSLIFIIMSKDNSSLGSWNKYDTTKEIASALKELEEDDSLADILTKVDTIENVVALTFQGMSNPETNRSVLNLLTQYNRKVNFFIPGILAAEDSSFVKEAYDKGHRIGSNTLRASKHMEKYSGEELVTDFIQGNGIFHTIIEKKPISLLCNSTLYTEEVLRAAHVSGIEYVVEPTKFLNYQSFKDYNQVLGYVNNLDKGSIITIKMDGILEEDEYDKQPETEKPAIDKQPTISEHEDKEDKLQEKLTPEEQLVQMVDWLLKAFDEMYYQNVFVEELMDFQDDDFNMDFTNLRKENNNQLAKVYTRTKIRESSVFFTFRGLEDKNQLDKTLEFLSKYNIKATFFVTVNDILNYPERIQKILDHHHIIGNGGMTNNDLTSMDFDEIALEIYKCDILLKERYKIETNLFMPAYGKYNNLVQEAASMLNYHIVGSSKIPILNKDISMKEIIDNYNTGFRNGDIIHFRLGYHEQLLEILNKIYELITKEGRKVGKLELIDEPITPLSQPIESIRTDRKSQSARKPTKPTKPTPPGQPTNQVETEDKKDGVNHFTKEELEKLRKKNAGKKAKEYRTIYTTEKALSFSFYGIENKEVLDKVLDNLDSLKAKGTFFISKNDLTNRSSVVDEIARRGHEIGISLSPLQDTDYYSALDSILTIQEGVHKLTNQKPALVRYPYDIEVNDDILEAVSTANSTVIFQDISIASSKVGINGSLEEVLKHVFHAGNITARRGYIIYYRMDYYNDPTIIPDTMLRIAKDRIDTIAYEDEINNNGSAYSIKTISSIRNSERVYSYPLSQKDILPNVRDKIYSGHLLEYTELDKFDLIKEKYIGNPDISTPQTLPGFTNDELNKIDTTGRVTEDKVLFLTFDDWGSDHSVNQILYVLEKHKIKGSFFIATQYVQSNPNLLRAIAEAGHDVGSHTDTHLPFAISENAQDEDDTSAIYRSITQEEIAERRKDLLLSYEKLQEIAGDISINNRPALNTMFRPPTLAMSKEGMETILDMGFDYIVSGDFSSHDYEDRNPEMLVDKLINGIELSSGDIRKIQNGSILILHMSDSNQDTQASPNVTAKALDVAIPILKSQGYRFARLSDYLTD